jgi:hypothetical protein
MGQEWQRMGLNGRNISSRGKEVQKCNEFGTVVVQITSKMLLLLNTKRTTNESCLVEPALATARKYRCNPMPMLLKSKLALLRLISN